MPARPAAARRGRPTGAVAVQLPPPDLDVFELLPKALMICDSRGRVVAANARLREELGAVAGGGASCCSLLGCGRPGSTLEDGCVSERVLARGDALEDFWVELPMGRMRVSVAPLHQDAAYVAIELRRESRQDDAAAPLRVYTFGGLRAEAAGDRLVGDWVDQRAGELLRYLVSERRRIAPADAIAEAIWPRAGASASNSVRHFVHVLREKLEPGRPRGRQSSYVICRRGGYALASDRVWVDADEFAGVARAGLAAFAAGDLRGAEPRLVRAARLYQGDFLADEPYADWALAEREHLRATACSVLRALADIRSQGPEASDWLERLAEMEPFDTDVQRRLIMAWLRDGRRSRAARHYESFRRRLMREFGERPGFELADLARAR